MRFDVLTLFPEMFGAVTQYGVSGRAFASGIWHLHCWNPRDFATRKMGYIDDRPFGGGPGMVMQAAPLSDSVHKHQGVACFIYLAYEFGHGVQTARLFQQVFKFTLVLFVLHMINQLHNVHVTVG